MRLDLRLFSGPIDCRCRVSKSSTLILSVADDELRALLRNTEVQATTTIALHKLVAFINRKEKARHHR